MNSIVTFYSFKGGVGRTMALANIAVLLAQRGKRVLMVDWDLEAPGLHDYFAGRVELKGATGLLHLLHESRNHPAETLASWHKHVSKVELPQKGALHLLYSGSCDSEYALRLEQFDWHEFFESGAGGHFVEQLRDTWREEYDYTFIDSRTGYTDAGGVCTMLLPDMLVAVFSANEQSLSGVEEAITKAQAGRQGLDVDRPPLLVVPLPSRFDGRVEVEEAERWTVAFTQRLAKYYDDWLPRGTSYRRVVERTRVPHVPFYSFGEKLPVLEHSLTDPEGMGRVYGLIAALLEDGFREADFTLLGERVDPAQGRAIDDLGELAGELETSILRTLMRRRRSELLARLTVLGSGLAFVVVSVLAFTLKQATQSLALVTALVTVTLGVVVSVFTTYAWRRTADRLSEPRTTARLADALDDLRVARRLDRERPDRLRRAYELAARELREAEGKGISSLREE